MSSCDYAKLGNYNNVSCGSVSSPHHHKQQIVPSYGGVGYNTLSHPNYHSNCPSSDGFFNIEKAYGSRYENRHYVNSLCQQPLGNGNVGVRNLGGSGNCYCSDQDQRQCGKPCSNENDCDNSYCVQQSASGSCDWDAGATMCNQ